MCALASVSGPAKLLFSLRGWGQCPVSVLATCDSGLSSRHTRVLSFVILMRYNHNRCVFQFVFLLPALSCCSRLVCLGCECSCPWWRPVSSSPSFSENRCFILIVRRSEEMSSRKISAFFFLLRSLLRLDNFLP